MTTKKTLTLLMASFTATLLFSASLLNGQEDNAPAEKEGAEQRAVMKNGKLFTIDETGKKQEVDMAGARSIAIQQSSRVVEQDGERVQVAGGTATIVDANGKKTVIEFDEGGTDIELPGIINLGMDFGAGADLNGDMAELLDQIRAQRARGNRPIGPNLFRMNRGRAGKYIVGVHCSPVGEAIRGHLQLEDSIGLMVDAVSPDSPATEAELQVHDILLFADDQALGTLEELTKVVELAGKEGRSLALTFIRDGTEQSTEITPKERPAGQVDRAVGGVPFRMLDLRPNLQLDEVGPGIVIPGPGVIDDVNPQMDQMLEQIRADMEKMKMDMKRMTEER